MSQYRPTGHDPKGMTMTDQDRVRHGAAGSTGTVLDRRPTFQGQPGPWADVQYDDGLRCWTLEESLEPIITLPDWYHTSRFDMLSKQLQADAAQRAELVKWIADIDSRSAANQADLDATADILRERGIQP